jgi:hypothetical protein
MAAPEQVTTIRFSLLAAGAGPPLQHFVAAHPRAPPISV